MHVNKSLDNLAVVISNNCVAVFRSVSIPDATLYGLSTDLSVKQNSIRSGKCFIRVVNGMNYKIRKFQAKTVYLFAFVGVSYLASETFYSGGLSSVIEMREYRDF